MQRGGGCTNLLALLPAKVNNETEKKLLITAVDDDGSLKSLREDQIVKREGTCESSKQVCDGQANDQLSHNNIVMSDR